VTGLTGTFTSLPLRSRLAPGMKFRQPHGCLLQTKFHTRWPWKAGAGSFTPLRRLVIKSRLSQLAISLKIQFLNRERVKNTHLLNLIKKAMNQVMRTKLQPLLFQKIKIHLLHLRKCRNREKEMIRNHTILGGVLSCLLRWRTMELRAKFTRMNYF